LLVAMISLTLQIVKKTRDRKTERRGREGEREGGRKFLTAFRMNFLNNLM